MIIDDVSENVFFFFFLILFDCGAEETKRASASKALASKKAIPFVSTARIMILYCLLVTVLLKG